MANMIRPDSASDTRGSEPTDTAHDEVGIRNRFGRVARSNLVVWGIALLLLTLATWFAERQQATRDPFGPPTAWTTLAWWVEPLERNAFLREPLISTDLTDIYLSPDRTRGWIVGSNGTILVTENNGATWKDKQNVTQEFLRKTHAVEGGMRGWAVGTNGTIVVTDNGGKLWNIQEVETKHNLNDVLFSEDGNHGWIIGNSGTIITTTNTGKSWNIQQLAIGTDLNDIHLTNKDQTIWLAGSKGTIAFSTDGGRSWDIKQIDEKADFSGIHFSKNGQRGWVVGSGGKIFSTDNGGTSWREISSDTKESLSGVYLANDGLRGWIYGASGVLLTTLNGGQTWNKTDIKTKARIYSLRFAKDKSSGWLIGRGGTILITIDEGDSWQAKNGGAKSAFNGVHFDRDNQNGWIAGGDGTLLSTRDRGATWHFRDTNPGPSLYQVLFLHEADRGWIVGNHGIIRFTMDGGLTWGSQESQTPEPLSSIHFSKEGLRGWTVGNNGTIRFTTDGGKSWKPQKSEVNSDLISVHFAEDGLRGWIVGTKGTVLATRNGGMLWSRHEVNTTANLNSIRFSEDGIHGGIVGDRGTILITSDGGSSWKSISSEFKLNLHSILFADDGRRGWIAGAHGLILFTLNGGSSWTLQDSKSRSDLFNLHFSGDGRHGWVVGMGGTILSTRDGGASWQTAYYQRYPAPWFWVTLTLILLIATGFCFGIEAGTQPMRRLLSIATRGRSDEPVSSIDQDRLNFRPVVDGLADYLRNSETRPPLTIAINAPWGQGKSSFMRMLQQRMEGRGVQCVWFNAWHHQKEEVLLAALLQAIREQALPPLLSLQGMRFRLRLLTRRLSAHPWLALLGLGGFAYPLCHLVVDFIGWLSFAQNASKSWVNYFLETWGGMASVDAGVKSWHDLMDGSGVVDALWALLKHVSKQPDLLVDALASLVFMIFSFVLLQYGLRAFPGSPAVLLASLSRGAKLTGLDDQTSYREKFKRHYRDVCASLGPRYPVLFIDDLDRCEPKKTAEMLEAVNFLSNSGECFIVLGMARDVVEAQLALHYKDLATQHASQTAPNDQDTPAEIDYVRRYLRKLVNLDIRLPSLNAERLRSMLELEKGTADSRGAWTRALDTLQRAWEAWIARAMRWTVLGLAMLYFATSLTDGLNTWKDDQHKAARSARAEIEKIEERLEIRTRQLHATLDIARGRSEQAASEVLEHTGIALPSDYAKLSQDVRKSIDAKAPGHLASKTSDPCVRRTDKASATSASSVYTETNARVLECWRHREALRLEIEETLKAVRDRLGTRTGISAGDTQKELESLERRLEEVLLRAERETGLADIPANSSVSTDRSTPPVDGYLNEQVGAGIVDLRDPNPTAWHRWAFAASLLFAAFFTLRRVPYLIQDGVPFRMALELWHPLLAMEQDQATPREIRRFENRARYYAMRLRPHPPQRKSQLRRFAEWLDRRGGGKPPDSPPDAKTSIPEELIVGLSAIRHAAPEHIDLAAAQNEEPGENEPRMRRAVAVFIRRHRDRARETNKATNGSGTAQKFEYWTITSSQLEQFLEVAGEYNAPTNGARK